MKKLLVTLLALCMIFALRLRPDRCTRCRPLTCSG